MSLDLFCFNIMQCHSYSCKYLDMLWGHYLLYSVDVYFLCFVSLRVTKKIYETTTGKQSESRALTLNKNFCQLVKLQLVLDVSDGCDQSLSTGFAVYLHRRQIALVVSSPSKGKKKKTYWPCSRPTFTHTCLKLTLILWLFCSTMHSLSLMIVWKLWWAKPIFTGKTRCHH